MLKGVHGNFTVVFFSGEVVFNLPETLQIMLYLSLAMRRLNHHTDVQPDNLNNIISILNFIELLYLVRFLFFSPRP